MSSQRSLCPVPALLGILLMLLLPSGGLKAQEEGPLPAPSLEEVGMRIEAQRPEVDRALRAAARADSLYTDSVRSARALADIDTILVGPFRIVTVPDQVELAREVFGDAWEAYRPLLSGAESVLSDQLFLFRYAWRFDGIYLEGDNIRDAEMSRRFGRHNLNRKVRNGIGEALLQGLPPDSAGLVAWVGVTPLAPPADWSWIYRELATTPSRAGKGCYRGEISRCWEAMGLSGQEAGWLNWYTSEERRLVVAARNGNFHLDSERMRNEALILHACLVLASDRGCLEILEDWEVVAPLSGTTRASLVTEALAQGGEGAYARLIQNPEDPIRERLVYAAGVPADTLMARWRRTALEGKPRTQAGLLLSPLSLALWLLLLLLLATRSTRWRLG